MVKKVNDAEQNDRLQREVNVGEKASKAYQLWVKDYIEKQHSIIFERFKNADQDQAFPFIRAEMGALTALDTAIRSDIQTGELAYIQLKGE